MRQRGLRGTAYVVAYSHQTLTRQVFGDLSNVKFERVVHFKPHFKLQGTDSGEYFDVIGSSFGPELTEPTRTKDFLGFYFPKNSI